MKFTRKLAAALAAATALLVSGTVGAGACTAIFAGGELTDTGAPIVARSEDYNNTENKLFIVNEAGKYKAGELFTSCPEYGGFEWIWTHDSYRFLSFTADNVYNGVCPECGEGSAESPVTHDSYTESGTNEMGVTVSATETISGNGKVNAEDVDPMRQDTYDENDERIYAKDIYGNAGIEETDIPTVILAEAATAREGVELLCSIYDTAGCYYASGLFIADQNETWYIENCSGTQYVAIKLPSDILFLNPNMAVIGLIDLDDTENVIASDRLIEVAKQAGTFVGNEEENVIDFRASYSRISMDNRLVNGLNFLNKDYNYTADMLSADNSLFTISNVDAEGNIVTLYTNIEADRPLTVDDIVNYYKVDGIGRDRNVDTAFFQLFSDRETEYGTVEWVAMDHCGYNVFVPYYPMLTTELYEGYGVGTPVAEFVTEEPAEGMYYPYSKGTWTQDETGAWSQVFEDGYYVFPEGWEDSYFWCFDVLSNYLVYVDDACEEYVLEQFAILQNQFYEEFNALDLSDPETAAQVATEASMDMARRAHELAKELIAYVVDYSIAYDDVATSDWFYDAAAYAVNRGFMVGMSETTFEPQTQLSRAMIAQMMYAVEGAPSVEDVQTQFRTDSTGEWYHDAAVWAVGATSIMDPIDLDFVPDQLMTREEFALVLHKYAMYKGILGPMNGYEALLSYEDYDQIDAACVDAMQWAYSAGVIYGKSDTTVNSKDTLTRAEAAQMLMKYIKILDENTFTAGENGDMDIADRTFTDNVTVNPAAVGATEFVDCEFQKDVVINGASDCRVNFVNCTFAEDSVITLHSDITEATIETDQARVMLVNSDVDVELTAAGTVIVVGNAVTVNGVEYTIDQCTTMELEDGTVVEYDPAMECSGFYIGRWWENGEEVILLGAFK